jgi:hypothetical protein
MAFALGTTAGAGTISIVAGGTVVTGVGTAFAAANVGSILVVGSQWGVIATVVSTTSITIDRPFTTAVTASAYTRSANIPIITQTGTDTSLSTLTGVPGVTTSVNLWTITSATLVINGSLTINRLTNRLRFLNPATLVTSTVSPPVLTIGATGTFNNSASQTSGGYTYRSSNYSIMFDGVIPAPFVATTASLIGTVTGSTSVFEGNIEFANTTSGANTAVLTFNFEGTTTLQYGALLNSSSGTGNNILFYVTTSTSNLTLNNYTSVGISLRVANNALTISNYAAIAGPNAININTASAINNAQYVGLQSLGNVSASIRTAAASLKYFQLINYSDTLLVPTTSLASNTGSQFLIVNQLALSATGASGAIQNVKFWAQDSNNGSRYSANYGAGTAYEIATTGNLTYTATTAASGIAPTLNMISVVYYQPTASTATIDYRGNNAAQDFNIYQCAYNYVLSNSLTALWPLNNGIYGGTAVRNQGFVLLSDTSITQTTMATVAAYTALDTAQQLYDYAKYILYTNFAGETATYVTRSGNVITAGSYNVTIDATAAAIFAFASSTITTKSSTFTGSLTTSGAVTLANGAVFSSNTVTANVLQATPTNFTGVTITGNLTYNTNTPITITLTNCAISGTVSNSGTGAITINLTSSTIGTVGANVTARITTSLNINGLTAGSQIYVADGSGTQVAYVASSSTSYTLDTTGQTGTWSWKVASYGYTAQTGTHSPAVASTTTTVTLVADSFITQATKATVAAYTVLDNNDKLYDYSAYYETTNAGIPYARVITKAGTSPSAGSYPVTINDTGDVWVFDGSSLSIFTNYTLAAGTTITGPLFTSGTVTIPTNVANMSITANVSQPDPSDLSGVTITGNLTYNTSAPFGINVTLTNCVITGTVSNAGTTDIVITKVNTTLGTVGTRVTAQQFATISAPNLISGTRVRIYNNTNSVELYNDVMVGAGFSQSFLYTGDKNVTLTATYTSSATAKLGVSTTGVFTATGVSFLNSQEDDTVYNGYAIDGSTVTGFSADYVQDDVNLSMITNWSAANAYAWWIYNTTTEDGIREFFGGLTALDAGNIENDASVVDLFLDNSTADFIYQTDSIRFFKSNGVYPARTVTTGGGGIQVNWNSNVYVGTANVPSSEQNATATINAMNAAPPDVNVAKMNGATVLGTGVSNDLWRG